MDTSDFVQSSQHGLLSVTQKSALGDNFVLDESNQAVLELSLASIRGDVKVESFEVEPIGTAHPSEISRIRVEDSSGREISNKLSNGVSTKLDFNQVVIHKGKTEMFTVYADVAGDSGRTFGLRIAHSRAVGSSNAGITVKTLPSANGLAYIGHANPEMEIDGAFLDWNGMLESDEIRESSTKGNMDIDIDKYSAVKNEQNAFFYLSMVDQVMAGCSVPQSSIRIADGTSTSSPDTDRDRVPDPNDRIGSVDYSRDFDNDGTPDEFESGDVDGDGLIDYPVGPDMWLNTTIPLGFQEPYSGTKVSVFIGRVEGPAVRGDDVLWVFIDSDQDPSTGYSRKGLGADYLVEIRGREGSVRDARLMVHQGSIWSWKWEQLGGVRHAEVYSQIELMVEKGRLRLDDGQTFDVLFETSDWNMRSSDSTDTPFSELTEDPFVLESIGVVFQSVDGGATWTQKGDAGNGAGYRAIVADHSGYLYVLRKNGEVYGSDDEGSTWTELSDIGNHQDLTDITIDGNDYLYAVRGGGEVYQSTDGGVNWNGRGDADPSASSGFIGIAYNSLDNLFLLVTNGTVYRSTDSGSTWNYRGDAGLDTDYQDITSDDRDYIYVITASGYINESQDDGSSWAYRGDVGSETYTAIEWGYDSYLYVVATTGEVYRSSDGGGSWTYRGDVGSVSDFTDFTGLIPEFGTIVVPLIIVLFPPLVSRMRRKKARNEC
ncbi:MAG: WD40/YVTN/BNR-like repeat-containing protein, partial [Thermoplasmata archaeon]